MQKFKKIKQDLYTVLRYRVAKRFYFIFPVMRFPLSIASPSS